VLGVGVVGLGATTGAGGVSDLTTGVAGLREGIFPVNATIENEKKKEVK
jgi:hypothetical protein